MIKKIGFIGLGIMGKHMVKNLLKGGYTVAVYDIVETAVEDGVKAGAVKAQSPADAAAQSEMVITMLPNSPHVKEAILGKNGVIEGAKPGTLIVDMSSIDPMISREIAAELAAKKINMMDAPVSGGEPKAIDGTLSIMVGGRNEDFIIAEPVLKAMGSSVQLVGETGAGNVTKLANQIIVALNIAAMSEAMVLAAKAGVDPELVYKAIRGGLAGSTVLDAKAPMVLNRNFKPGFRINLHIKDLVNVLNASHELGVSLPLTAAVMEIMQAVKADGMGDDDHSSIARYYEKLAHVEAVPGKSSNK